MILKVTEHDFPGFYQQQILERSRFSYPPYVRLIRLTLKHRDAALLDKAATELAYRLRAAGTGRVLGPEYPVVARIKGLYLKNIILKMERGATGKADKDKVLPLLDQFRKADDFRQVVVSIDVDPM